MAAPWQIEGTYLEACNCDIACPCVFGTPPPPGTCTVLIGWHINQGHYGGLELAGLNVALAASIPGLPANGKWAASIYIDSHASAEQADALKTIYTGQAGGQPGALAGAIVELLGVSSTEIEFQAEGKHRRLHIPEIATAEMEALEDQAGEEVVIANLPRWISRGYSLVVAKAKQLRYRDHEMQWELSDKNGFYSPFTYSGS